MDDLASDDLLQGQAHAGTLRSGDWSKRSMAMPIFYLTDDDERGRGGPQDILFQLHVAVANTGARKAVVSRLRLLRFENDAHTPVEWPNLPPAAAQQYIPKNVYGANDSGSSPRR